MRELNGEQVEAWRCQATDALKFSEPLENLASLARYGAEFRNGNFTSFRLHPPVGPRVRTIGGRPRPDRLAQAAALARAGRRSPVARVGLRPGDLVQVRSAAEIEATLDEKGMNRGLSFDREMLPYCGRTVRVKDTVDRIVMTGPVACSRSPKTVSS